MPSPITLRVARPGDAPALLAVYAPYVRDTAVSFEYEVPSQKEFARRIARTLEKYPYLAAQREGELLGYACTGPFVGRAAYGWAAETSIYLRQDCRRQGAGRALYAALEAISRAQHLTVLYACIGSPEVEDEHLSHDSERFHARMGYRLAGTFRRCGRKFGRWYNMVWMEKPLTDDPGDPGEVIPFPELDPAVLEALHIGR